uniref:Prostaglandin reductase 1 n=2 Tax=Photinus pyralis TaxID=7054 RepID=A0A1Y1MPC9_PHOPY
MGVIVKMVKAKKFVLRHIFEGLPKPTDVEIVEEELPCIQHGEFLMETLFLSVDPYIRAFEQTVGDVVIGKQVAKIIESKSRRYPVGKYVVNHFGWRTYTIAKDIPAPEGILPDFGNVPLSLALGMLGMTGNTAYFGFLEKCKPKRGDVVVISGAAGAVGSHVGQIAKIFGCKVIGIMGSDAKGKYVTEELCFDHFINYKKGTIKEDLNKFAPKGVNCYFDGVGGELSSTIIHSMAPHGRIAVVGTASEYNDDPTKLPKVTPVQSAFVGKLLQMEGFQVYEYAPRWNEGIEQNLKWIQQGQLKYKETITEGFENTFKAFVDMLQGKHTGKAIIKV